MLMRFVPLARAVHMFVLFCFLLFILLTTILSFIAHIQRRAEGITFAEFEHCQQTYCETLAHFLNIPIEWHVVLDVSESYVGSRTKGTFRVPSQKISSLLGALPLSQGDALCLDSFDVEYRPGACRRNLELDWIGSAVLRTASVKKIAESLAPPAPLSKSEATDFYKALRDIAATDDTCRYNCGSRIFRRYYLFLTDGRHDPENAKTFLPLFPENKKAPRFAAEATRIVLPRANASAKCPNLGQLVRGLHFVVDQERATHDVVSDWQKGTLALKNTNSLHRLTYPKTRPFLPRITLWDPSLGSPNLYNQISTIVDRNPGIYPCLQDGAVPTPQTPHKYAFPNSTLLPSSCSQLRATGYRVALPPSLLSTGDGHIEFPFYLLQRGNKNETVRLTLTTEDPLAPKESKTRRLRTPKETVGEWVPQRVAFTLPVSGSALATQPLPVKAEYGFGRWENSQPVLTLHLYSSSILHIIDHILSWRGMLPVILATIFLIVSWLFFYKAEQVAVTLTLKINNGTREQVRIFERLHRNGARFHLHENGTFCGTDELRPYKMPKEVDFRANGEVARLLIDVIPLGSVVYCLLWCLKDKIEKPDLLIPSHEGVKGGAFSRGGIWVRDPSVNQRTTIVWEWICERLSPRSLRWPSTIPAKLEGANQSYKLDLAASFQTTRTWHFWKKVFNLLAFSSILVSCFQLWAPDVYGWLVLNSSFLHSGLFPESALPYLICGGLISLLFLVLFLLRLLNKPTGSNAEYFLQIGKMYIVSFWTLFLSSWMFVIFSPGTALWFALLGVSAGGAVAPFLLEKWWFRKRIESERSFWVSDMVMDSFLALGPIAS